MLKERFKKISAVACLGGFLLLQNPLSAEEAKKPLYPGFPALEESRAYQQYQLRPKTELSKLIFLIDRFGPTELQVIYDDIYYPAPLASKIVRAYVAVNYHNETADYWMKNYATISIFSGKPVWLKLPDESFIRARDLFLEELAELDNLTDPKPRQMLSPVQTPETPKDTPPAEAPQPAPAPAETPRNAEPAQ